MRQYLLVSLLLGGWLLPGLSACAGHSALDQVYDRATEMRDLQAIRAAGELSDQQCHAVQRYISRAQTSNVNQPVAGRTYRQLARQARNFKPEKYVAPATDSLATPPPFGQSD